MFKINNNTKIFVACPAKFKSGGPELLHQLVCELTKLGFDAYMFYQYANFFDNSYPVHPEFKKYNNKWVTNIKKFDNEDNILIVPETTPQIINKYKNIQKCIWWLSVDNYLNCVNHVGQSEIHSLISRLFFDVNEIDFKIDKNKKIKHLCQSEYAIDFVQKLGITNYDYLADYISDDYFGKKPKIKKENIVLYNPKKGIEFTKMLIMKNRDIKFIPIENMTTKQVRELLYKAKVYIDFGNHPGMDRFPREAAICNCCVITGKRGSANFYEDLPISDEFKFDDKIKNIDGISKKIKYIFNNYEKENEKFKDYRKFITEQKSNFVNDIKKIFGEQK